jgi:predicted Rossmann fold flavoprotein
LESSTSLTVAVIGGGAAGYFGAIAAAEKGARVTLFEAATKPLSKVRISGGGRCNVTTHCFDPRKLVKHYPRGGKELLGPVTRFGARETWNWFEQRGVPLKVEPDGRVFPQSDKSDSITDCLEHTAEQLGVTLLTRTPVRRLETTDDGSFTLDAPDSPRFDRVLIACGSADAGYSMAERLGHTLVPRIPSLFTFKISDPRINELPGVSVPSAHLRLTTSTGERLEDSGPVLITHWGLSGPAILRLSAWGARILAESNYEAKLTVNWLGESNTGKMVDKLLARRNSAGATRISSDRFTGLPSRLWSSLVSASDIAEDATWAGLSKKPAQRLAEHLTATLFSIQGRGEFKEEFVTAGGVSLKEINFRTMESRVCPGLYLAGEILDIDGITGGYNLQSAWTCGRIAGEAMAER